MLTTVSILPELVYQFSLNVVVVSQMIHYTMYFLFAMITLSIFALMCDGNVKKE